MSTSVSVNYCNIINPPELGSLKQQTLYSALHIHGFSIMDSTKYRSKIYISNVQPMDMED